eukprot:365948-Chlamydomonas_euryale.AAC.14
MSRTPMPRRWRSWQQAASWSQSSLPWTRRKRLCWSPWALPEAQLASGCELVTKLSALGAKKRLYWSPWALPEAQYCSRLPCASQPTQLVVRWLKFLVSSCQPAAAARLLNRVPCCLRAVELSAPPSWNGWLCQDTKDVRCS